MISKVRDKRISLIPGLGIVFLLLFAVYPGDGQCGQWYIRGGLGWEWSLDAQFYDPDSSSTNPPALFGTIPGNDGRQIGAYGDFGKYPVYEAAFGMQALEWLRTDISLTWRPNVDFTGEANFAISSPNQPVSADGETWTAMLNLFLEPARLIGFDTGIFIPYIGIGAGASHNRIDRMTYLFPDGVIHKISITPSGSKTDFAYAVAAGTGIRLSRDFILDISYRYSDLGRMETDSGNMYMNHVPAGIGIAGTAARIRTHGIVLGLRYQL
jgi:opacity protein-like surface antigen